jgi:hypothetical protein
MNEPMAGLIQVGDVVQWARQKRGKTVKHSGVVLFFGVDCVVVEDMAPVVHQYPAEAVPISRITKVY